MTTKQSVIALARSCGVVVNSDGGGRYREVALLAPRGQRFRVGPHELIYEANPYNSINVCWGSALGDLQRGLEPCTDSDCCWCAGE